jgi:hypothetical protein
VSNGCLNCNPQDVREIITENCRGEEYQPGTGSVAEMDFLCNCDDCDYLEIKYTSPIPGLISTVMGSPVINCDVVLRQTEITIIAVEPGGCPTPFQVRIRLLKSQRHLMFWQHRVTIGLFSCRQLRWRQLAS